MEDQRDTRIKREIEEVLELKVPDLPTPKEEVEYIEWLQDDFKSDPWLTFRFKKYMAGPKRIPWRNQRELKRQYYYNFAFSWALGTALSWPLAVLFGRRMQKTWSGVPLVPIQYSKHDFINVSPGNFARRQFRVFGFGGAIAAGWVFAFLMTERDGWRSDKWKNRPDLKPHPHMVKPTGDDIDYQTMRE